MGFLGSVPASNLGAVYDPFKQVLTVTASGEAQKFTYGYFFKRVAWAGGLRFELWGWTGPIGEGTAPFSYSQDFSIPNLQLNDPSNTAIIVTAKNPNGKVININWTGLKPPTASSTGSEVLSSLQDKLSSGDKPAPPQTIDASSPLTINALFKEAFNVSEKISTALGATLHLDFDPQILTMTEAGIDDGVLNWTFNSIQTGLTQVVTYRTNGLGTPVIRKVYNVKVFVLEAAKTNSTTPSVSKAALLAAKSNGNGTSNGATNGSVGKLSTQAILSFLGRVFEAQHIAQAVLPSARLLRVQATNPAIGLVPIYPVTDPLMLSQLAVLFVADDAGGEYVTVQSTGWGEWAPPVVSKGSPPVLGLSAFDLDSVKVDIVQAVQAIRDSGNDKSFWEATLAQPFGNPQDGPYQPLYSFRMVDTSYATVNAVTGKVLGK